MLMTAALACVLAGLAAATPSTTARTAVTVQGGPVVVTASYKGKGPVDDKHAILIFLFDHPEPTAASEPLGLQRIVKNGDTATFPAVSAKTVYVVLVYDEKSNYDGQSGPPPVGAPIGYYLKGGKPVPITPGAGAKVTVAFDDSRRWK
jgi:hypothetical protein